jgi:cytoskeletal protein CcmA (bactofilin family)
MADLADDLGILMNPVRPMARATVPQHFPDPPRAGDEWAHTPASLNQRTDQSVGSQDGGVEPRTLIVGREISFSGDITSCDRLIIEGSIKANLKNCQNMMIAETGIFRGNGSTDNAEVRGRVEGDLVVHKRLLIRASGHVSGRITYGEIEIEAGGKISGVIQGYERPKGFGVMRA